MPRIHSHPLGDEATLKEVREFVEQTGDLPDTARVFVRIGFGRGSRHGSRPVEVTAAEMPPAKAARS